MSCIMQFVSSVILCGNTLLSLWNWASYFCHIKLFMSLPLIQINQYWLSNGLPCSNSWQRKSILVIYSLLKLKTLQLNTFAIIGLCKHGINQNVFTKHSCPRWQQRPHNAIFSNPPARCGGAEVAGWMVDRKIRVRFLAYPHRVWPSDDKEINRI